MPIHGESVSSADRHNSVEPLPLFRPEALAATQQKFYGEIILIRPFSLILLGWFGAGIAAAVLGFLLLGQYTERAHVPGMIIGHAPGLQAEFYVPGGWVGRLHPGAQVAMHCVTCSPQFLQQPGIVLEVPEAPLSPAELLKMDLGLAGPVYKIIVSLSPQPARISQLNPSPHAGMRVEADIPLGRKPLIRWFFERTGS
jgi:hypothetical protein